MCSRRPPGAVILLSAVDSAPPPWPQILRPFFRLDSRGKNRTPARDDKTEAHREARAIS